MPKLDIMNTRFSVKKEKRLPRRVILTTVEDGLGYSFSYHKKRR